MPPEVGPRVAVTGVGTVSALGAGGGGFLADALATGPAIGPVRGFATAACPSHLGGEAGDLAPHLDPDERRRLPRASQLAVVACRLAAADAGLERGALAGLGLVLGSAWGDFHSSETFARGFLGRGPLGLSPLVFPHTVMNAMAAQAALALWARGPMLTLNQIGVAGEVAIGRGAALVLAGRAPAVLAGGVDELSEVLFREVTRLRATSPGPRGEGLEGCWPFDRRANGLVLGEGATVVLLEEAGAARARGARVYAEVTGAAWGNLPAPARRLPPRRGRDPAVILRALRAARCAPAEVDAAYLTGAAEPARDECELDLVSRAFAGARRGVPLLTALTPLVGEHAGLGALRVAAAAVATLAGGRLPGLPDLAHPVREDLGFVTGPGCALAARTVLVHGLAAGGGHAAVVLGRAA